MSLRRLQYFVAVAEEGTFGRAAARMGIQQPPLSQSVRRLERELGTLLLERGPRGVTLTAAGRAFLPEARAAVSAAERGVALARAAAHARTPVRIGVVSVALWEVLPEVLRAARERDITVNLQQLTTNEQLIALSNGELDLGLVVPPFEAPARMQVTALANERVVVAAPVSIARTESGSIALEAIAERLILFPRADGPILYDAILALFRSRGLEPRIVQESPRMLTTLALVAAGRGASLVPAAIARNIVIKGVTFHPLTRLKDAPAWPVSLAHMPLSARSDTAVLLAHWRRGPRTSRILRAPHTAVSGGTRDR
jgi:DNA-binding transcriptional LysR family regulator